MLKEEKKNTPSEAKSIPAILEASYMLLNRLFFRDCSKRKIAPVGVAPPEKKPCNVLMTAIPIDAIAPIFSYDGKIANTRLADAEPYNANEKAFFFPNLSAMHPKKRAPKGRKINPRHKTA
jgi:hypothetical protein